MKKYITLLFTGFLISSFAAEIDINGKFVRGMDGWLSPQKKFITEIKTDTKNRFQLKLGKKDAKQRIMVYSRVYSAGSAGDKITLSAVASGSGAGYVGIACFDYGGNQTNIVYRYFYPGKEMKKYTFDVVIPESRRKDHKGNLRKTSKLRIIFGIQPGASVLFSEVDAIPVIKAQKGSKGVPAGK